MKMNILSLFDGISTGYLALKEAGIPITNYYASEIDKYAIAISKHNFPDIIHLGDIKTLDISKLPKIDILFAGFPCQSFSIAGNRKGFDDERGNLFFDLMRIFKEAKPKYFLFENVASMKKEHREKLDELIGVKSVMINSALVSAQQRKRLYWCNWKIEQPEDKEIYLKDVLESGVTERDKSYCITSTYSRACPRDYFLKKNRQLIFKKPIRIGKIGKGGQGERIYHIDGKSVCLSAKGGGQGAKTGLYEIKDYVRKLTPIECERLQTLPDGFTAKGIIDGKVVDISNAQRYKTLGNGWTKDVIVHILKNIKTA